MSRICPEAETPAATIDPTEDQTLDHLESALEDLSAALRGLTELLVVKATALAWDSSAQTPSSPHATSITLDSVRRRGRIALVPRRLRMRRRASGS